MYMLRCENHFDSTHFLTDYFGKCENIHGHRWKVVVSIAQNELQTKGSEKAMVMDFGRFKKAVHELCLELDHRFLLEEGSLNQATIDALTSEGFILKFFPFRTTAENLARWVFEELEKRELPVYEVQMYETPNNCAIYRPYESLKIPKS